MVYIKVWYIDLSAYRLYPLRAHLTDTHALQDVEFTVQDGRLFMLQCRGGKRTGAAALQIATDMQR